MKLIVTSGIILSLAAFPGAQEIKLSTQQAAQPGEYQSVKPGVATPMAGIAKSTAAVKKAPVSVPGVIVIQPSGEKPAAPKPAAAPAKPAEVKPAAAVKSTAPVAAPAPAQPAEVKPAASPIRSVETKTAEVKPASATVKAAEIKPAAAPAPVKPSEVKPAAVPAAAPVKVVEVKPAAVIAPAKPAETKPAQPVAEAAKADVPAAGSGGGFAVTRKHLVVEGETLWDLSNKYYKDPFKWGKIYNGNLDKISDPDRIYPMEEIFIPEITEVIRPAPRPETVTDMGVPGSEEGVAVPAAKAAAPAEAEKAAGGLLDKEPLEDLAASMSEEMPADLKEWSDSVKIAPAGWDPDGVITGVIRSDTDAMPGGLAFGGEMVRIKAYKKGVLKPGQAVTAYMKGAVAVDKNGKELGRELQKTGVLEVVSVDGLVVKARVIEALTSVDADQLIVK